MTGRAAKRVRKVLGQRLRALRTQRGLSQERLGKGSGLSGKFIGEVERGEKSISIDSLYRVSVALEVPLRDLMDIGDKHTVPTEEAQKIFALVSRWRRPEDVRKAYNVLRAMFSRVS
jgi:XRE family transcriptional regulator, regulator of sulfur utilization